MEEQTIQTYVDLRPNSPQNEQTKQDFGNLLRQQLEQRLEPSVKRIWELPPIILQNPDGAYADLLIEARELFIAGHFYSCVAMAGIVGERLVKDLFRASVLVDSGGTVTRPAGDALDQLEHVDTSGIVRFLRKAGLLGDQADKAAKDLAELRNKYAHARGKEPHADAIKAIQFLHALVEGTVSIFKDFEITEAGLLRKTAAPK